ncbi:histidine phosphatase family protein [Mycolicibacter sp. MYC123]|uniref:Histidine phosphatase family protein n=1 Tax=[Mycobacterium] zoologicum TaxID=2872311 RepID=A0ABU5YF81_9MYCO|nr:histidine phosphatase family protein [Mycolicibacter sp. MYC123]MEB3048708.1 histidine phosphatase family protein [Mycolicibacter sp. MYC123]
MPGMSFCGTSAVILSAGLIAPAAAPASPVPTVLSRPDVALTAQDIVLDLVRHAEDLAPANSRIPFSPEFPGAGISDLGKQQAIDTANQIFGQVGGPGHVAGLFSGPDTDAQDTAVPFAALQGLDPQVLNGLVEVDGGPFANQPVLSLGGIYYDVAVVLWMLGLVNAFQIPGADEYNGVVVNDNYTEAVNAMYTAAVANPVVGDDGNITAVGYTSEASMMIWTMLNVKNPDPMALVNELIASLQNGGSPGLVPNAGLIQLAGNPEDGWTLVSWAGQQVPENPGVLGDLFLIWRDLALPPQVAFGHILDALASGDSVAVTAAFSDGLAGISAGLDAVPDTITNLFTDLAAGTW